MYFYLDFFLRIHMNFFIFILQLFSLIHYVFITILIGGGKEVRTPDPLLAKQVLSQLSYTPN